MFRRLTGLIAMLLGMAGTVLCLALIVGIWGFKSNLMGSGINLLAPADTAFLLLEEAMQQTTEVIDDTQNHLRSIDPNLAVTHVTTRITHTQSKVAVAGQTLTSLHQFIGSFQQALDWVGAARLQTLSSGLDSKLHQFQASFQEIHDLAEKISAGRGGLVNQLSMKLDQLQTQVDTVVDGVDKGQATLTELQHSVQPLMWLLALSFSALFLWLALGQWLLARWGWRKMTSSGNA